MSPCTVADNFAAASARSNCPMVGALFLRGTELLRADLHQHRGDLPLRAIARAERACSSGRTVLLFLLGGELATVHVARDAARYAAGRFGVVVPEPGETAGNAAERAARLDDIHTLSAPSAHAHRFGSMSRAEAIRRGLAP